MNIETIKILSAISTLLEERKAHQAQVDNRNAQIAELSLKITAEDAVTLEGLVAPSPPESTIEPTTEIPTIEA